MAWIIIVLTLSISAAQDGTVTEKTRSIQEVGDYSSEQECEQAREKLVSGLGKGFRSICLNYEIF